MSIVGQHNSPLHALSAELVEFYGQEILHAAQGWNLAMDSSESI